MPEAHCPAYNLQNCFSAEKQNPIAWMFLGALEPKYTEELFLGALEPKYTEER